MNKKHSLVSLHNHTSMGSPLDAIIDVKDYITQARLLNATSIGISDHGSMASWIEFQEHCKKNGIKPIAGCEFYGFLSSNPTDKKSYHVLVIAKNEIGWRNLLKLNHLSNTIGFYGKPRISEKMIFEHKEGLLIGNACISGFITRHLMKGDEITARVIAEEFRNELGHNYFAELMPHDNSIQASINLQLMQIAKDLGIQVGITLDTHFKDMSYEEAYLINGRNRRGITKSMIDNDPPEDCLLSADFTSKTCECIIDTLVDHGLDRRDVLAAMDYTVQIDKEIDFEFKDKFELPEISKTPNEDLERILGQRLVKKFGNKNLIPNSYKERLRYEFEVTKKKGFSQYFLLLLDIIDHAKSNNMTVGPGRGSAGGSLMAYILEITEVDPLLYSLPYERFDNPARTSILDIDVDVSPSDRPKIIDYLKKKYGNDNVVQMITFGEVKAKAAIKEIAKYMEVPFAEVNAICSNIPSLDYDDDGALTDVSLTEALEIPEVAKYQKENPKLFELALKLEHSYKSVGCHAGAIILCPRPIYEIAPTAVKKSDGDILMVGYDKKGCEKVGLVKLDCLGLSTLDVIKECENLTGIKRQQIPLDDKKTWEFISKAEHLKGIFQLSENKTKRYLREVKPQNIIDLSIINSCMRPGSDYSTFINNRKNNVIKPEVDLPIIRDTLKDTYGSVVFQDDLMFLISNTSEFTLGEADLLRRALEKNDKEKIEEYKKKYSLSCRYPDRVDEIFSWLESKVGYAFAKAHAVAYSIIGYYTAWYKSNHCHQSLIANIKNPKSNNKLTESEYIGEFINEAREMGMNIELPNIGRCKLEPYYNRIEDTVYLGLTSLKGITEKPAEVILEACAEFQGDKFDFEKFCDFCINKKITTDKLTKTGASIKRSIVTKAHLKVLISIGFFGSDVGGIIAKFNEIYKEDWEFSSVEESCNTILGFEWYSIFDKYKQQLDRKYQDSSKYLVAKVLEKKSGTKNNRSWNFVKFDTAERGQVTAFFNTMPAIDRGAWLLLSYSDTKKGGDSINVSDWKPLI